MALATGGKRHAHKARGFDLYETPPEAVQALLAHEELPHRLWEPACGPGAIVRVLRGHGHHVHATDLNDWGCPDSQAKIDFLMERRALAGVEAIITNPPYMIATAFVAHAVSLARRVYMLLPLQFLEGGQRNPRRDALIDGGQLSHVMLFRERLPMMHRYGWEGKQASSTRCYAWFVWDQTYKGATIAERISWKRLAASPPKQKPRETAISSRLDVCVAE
jgi:hypothetical protein